VSDDGVVENWEDKMMKEKLVEYQSEHVDDSDPREAE
jgi:hypothetical protein